MKCPFCNHPDSKVVDSRPTDEGGSIRRRRECIACQKRFTTYEIIEQTPLFVVKKDGSRQLFDRSKIINGLLRACVKREVPSQKLEQIADGIEQYVQNSPEREVDSTVIGEEIMQRLKEIDQVAYVRFASVYRSFEDVNSFLAELNRLQEEE